MIKALLKAYGLPLLVLAMLISAGLWYRHHVATEAYADGLTQGKADGVTLATQARQAQGKAEQRLGQCQASLASVDEQTEMAKRAAAERMRAAQAAQAAAQAAARKALVDLAAWKDKYRVAVASDACSHARDQLCAALQDY